METILDRAQKAYPLFLAELAYQTHIARSAYIKGATDQSKIEIEHACQAYCKTCMYRKDKCETDWKCQAYADFREAMEE